MPKRPGQPKPDHDKPRKRFKPSGRKEKLPTIEPEELPVVESAEQLQGLLTLQQDVPNHFLSGLRAFEAFLSTVSTQDGKTSGILRSYLDLQSPRSEGVQAFPRIMQAWSFAINGDNVDLLAAIPATLAVLLRTLDRLLDFRDYGMTLCRLLLSQPHLTWLAKGAAAPLYRERLICRSYELLTSIVTFDAGAAAREVFLVKSYTLDTKYLSRNLSLWKHTNDYSHLEHPPRFFAVNYVLAHCRYQAANVKNEILGFANVFRCVFESLKHDSFEVVKRVLDCFREYVLLDDDIPAQTKGYTFGDRNLSHIASLHRAEGEDAETDSDKRKDSLAYSFLKTACLDPKAGLFRPSSGWYPPGTDSEDQELPSKTGDLISSLGLESIEWYDQYQDQVIVRNGKLSIFAQSLRPYANKNDSDLLLGFFAAAPELVADYFLKKAGFAFDPKLTATWIGYASFIFSAVRLPVPENFNGRATGSPVPPPVSIIMENILPSPVSQKVLTRCLNQQHDLITFFAIKIMSASFDKLQSCIKTLASRAREPLWKEAMQRLLAEFSSRCPSFKDVFNTFRKTPENIGLQREACLRLLRQYYKVTPHLAATEKVDFSPFLHQAMLAQLNPASTSSTAGSSSPEDKLPLLQLNHLLQIVRRSPTTRWFHPPSPSQLTPFMTLVHIASKYRTQKPSSEIMDLIHVIGGDSDLFMPLLSKRPCLALLASVVPSTSWLPSEELLRWIDDLIQRGTRRQMKYLDDYDDLLDQVDWNPNAVPQDSDVDKDQKPDSQPISLIFTVIAEQLAHALGKEEDVLERVSWIARFMSFSSIQGEDEILLDAIVGGDRIGKMSKDARRVLNEKWKLPILEYTELLDLDDSQQSQAHVMTNGTTPSTSNETTKTIPSNHTLDTTLLLTSPSPPHPTAKTLHQPLTLLLSAALSPPHATALHPLIHTLSSPSAPPSLLQQSLRNLLLFRQRLLDPSCTHPENTQLVLLLGAFCNTASPYLASQKRVPGLFTALTLDSIPILLTPSSTLYPLINSYLLLSPTWSTTKLLPYFLHHCLRTPPDPPEPDALRQQRAFFLDLIYESLVTVEDFETTLGRRNILSSVLRLGAPGPGTDPAVLEKVVRILWRIAGLGSVEDSSSDKEQDGDTRAASRSPPADTETETNRRTGGIGVGATHLLTHSAVIPYLSALIGFSSINPTTTPPPSEPDLTTKPALQALLSSIWARRDRSVVARWDPHGEMLEVEVVRLIG